jgi:hypothetical protein
MGLIQFQADATVHVLENGTGGWLSVPALFVEHTGITPDTEVEWVRCDSGVVYLGHASCKLPVRTLPAGDDLLYTTHSRCHADGTIGIPAPLVTDLYADCETLVLNAMPVGETERMVGVTAAGDESVRDRFAEWLVADVEDTHTVRYRGVEVHLDPDVTAAALLETLGEPTGHLVWAAPDDAVICRLQPDVCIADQVPDGATIAVDTLRT